MNSSQSFDVAVVGAGFAGTWFWNRYPGARCDVESMPYLRFPPYKQKCDEVAANDYEGFLFDGAS